MTDIYASLNIVFYLIRGKVVENLCRNSRKEAGRLALHKEKDIKTFVK
jgi:hypothetical protein